MTRFILLALAAFYVQYVVTTSSFPPAAWLRDRVERRFGEESSWADGVACGWCLGAWLTFCLFAADHYRPIPLPILQAVAGAAVVGLLSSWNNR